MIQPHQGTSFPKAARVSLEHPLVTQLKAVMETAPGAYGYLNQDGSVAWMQGKAQAWLLEFFPKEVTGGNLPRSVEAMVWASISEGGTPQTLIQTGAQEFLTLVLSLAAMGGWILRMERRPKKRLEAMRSVSQLTPRENEVMRWMVAGKRNAEIATILKTSSRTVEKQVQFILAKLEAENRTTAIIRVLEMAAQPRR